MSQSTGFPNTALGASRSVDSVTPGASRPARAVRPWRVEALEVGDPSPLVYETLAVLLDPVGAVALGEAALAFLLPREPVHRPWGTTRRAPRPSVMQHRRCGAQAGRGCVSAPSAPTRPDGRQGPCGPAPITADSVAEGLRPAAAGAGMRRCLVCCSHCFGERDACDSGGCPSGSESGWAAHRYPTPGSVITNVGRCGLGSIFRRS